MVDRRYLEPSPIQGDGGNFIGKQVEKIRPEDLAALGHPESPTRSIRLKCLDCCCGDASEVRKCVMYDCPLWPFRMGRNPYRSAKAKARGQRFPK